jgi:hypothetical protein
VTVTRRRTGGLRREAGRLVSFRDAAHVTAHSAAKHRRHVVRGEFIRGFGDGAAVYNAVAPILPASREQGRPAGSSRLIFRTVGRHFDDPDSVFEFDPKSVSWRM